MKKIRITLKSINQVHKFTGITVCIFLIHLSITGIFLNHTEELGLGEKYTASPLILSLYNITIPDKEESFLADNHFISRFGNQVFLDNKPVFKSEDPIIGAVIFNQMIAIAFKNGLFLLTEKGELIEKLTTATGVPENIQKLGVSGNMLFLKTNKQVWESNDEGLEWDESNSKFNEWSNEVVMSDEKTQQVKSYFLGKGISLEQFFLDLHNGNIIKGFGKWFLDIIAIFLLLISISGIWIWLRKRRY
tara:strand:+ start:57 stop:797 length:741 start_codon:yes stop_codon:yes gene_type:complete